MQEDHAKLLLQLRGVCKEDAPTPSSGFTRNVLFVTDQGVTVPSGFSGIQIEGAFTEKDFAAFLRMKQSSTGRQRNALIIAVTKGDSGPFVRKLHFLDLQELAPHSIQFATLEEDDLLHWKTPSTNTALIGELERVVQNAKASASAIPTQDTVATLLPPQPFSTAPGYGTGGGSHGTPAPIA